MLPPSVPMTPVLPVSLNVTLTGDSIADNTPLTMSVYAPISAFARGSWTIGPPITVTPDNARPVSSGSASTPVVVLGWQTTDKNDTEIWNGTEIHLELTTFGVLGVTVGMYIEPSPPMLDWERASGKYVGYGGYLTIPNSTQIVVGSSVANAAEASAEKATETGNSLAWFIIFFASLDVGFKFYEYSSKEEKKQRRKGKSTQPQE